MHHRSKTFLRWDYKFYIVHWYPNVRYVHFIIIKKGRFYIGGVFRNLPNLPTKMERFAKIVNGKKLLTVCVKCSVLDVCLGSEYASESYYKGKSRSRFSFFFFAYKRWNQNKSNWRFNKVNHKYVLVTEKNFNNSRKI